MKKNIVKMIISVFACLCLVGCQKPPEQVVENMKEYGQNEQVEEETEITYCSASELKDTDVKSIVDKYDVNIPDNIDFSAIEEISELTVKYKENFVAENEKKYADLFGFDISNLKEIGSNRVGGLIKQGDDEEKKIHYGIGDNGFLAYMSGHWFDESIESNVEKRYDILKEDISNVSIDSDEEIISLSDLCKENEEWFNKNIGTSTLTYNVTDALVREIKYESETVKKISLCGEFNYKGIYFNNHLYNVIESNDGTYKTIVTNAIMSEYEDGDTMVRFTVNNNLFEIIDSKKIDRVVDFESAVRIVEEKLASFNQFEFCDVRPLYIMETISDDSGNIDPSAPGMEIVAKPVYAFLEKGNLSYDELPDDIVIALNKYNRFVYVDMVTGELVTDIGK